MSGKEFPNNFDAIANAPAEIFEPVTFEEFITWRLCAWEIPSSVSCIIRAEHTETGKITEHVYSRDKAAQNRLIKYLQGGDHEITVANHNEIHLLKTKQ